MMISTIVANRVYTAAPLEKSVFVGMKFNCCLV